MNIAADHDSAHDAHDANGANGAKSVRSAELRKRAGLRIGRLWVDSLTFDQAMSAIEDLIVDKKGGRVFTPNVDHVCMAEHDDSFVAVYDRADLSLADGLPLVLGSRLLPSKLPERVSGSDIVEPLMAKAAAHGWSVYFLGGAPGVGAAAKAKLLERYPALNVIGVDAPMIRIDESREDREKVIAPIRLAKPDIVLVALGAPKQEILIDQIAGELAPSVFLGIGASLDFIAGTVERAPLWARKIGLEWAHRLVHDPVRLWRRYLVRDAEYPLILLRQIRESRNPSRSSSKNPSPDT